MPRTQVGPQPQHLLLTLLGDYWFGCEESIPSAALVRLLAEFGVTGGGARAALSRLARRGLLISSKNGRNTSYRLSPEASEVLEDGVRRIMHFGGGDRPWDGRWTCIAFSVPEDQRATRHALRTQLRWLGFAPLYDGLWVAPRGSADGVSAVLDRLGVSGATIIVGRLVERASGAGHPLAAWDLDGLRLVYDEFIARFRPLRERMLAGTVGAAEGLVARTEIMDVWRNMPNLDPELPASLLPPGWPQGEARELFVQIYDGLGPLGELRVREIVSTCSPELGRLAAHHGSDFVGRLDRPSVGSARSAG